ncbi:MAG: excinuclease ABC subunit UvrC [Bacteriovoracales bacterium]|nr:excinuclease ABC subunit UvrC [Bacteriovoracales bacterium]
MQELKDLAQRFPKLPGCYLMKNRKGEVIYVGKAKNLKNRIKSYFHSTHQSPKTKVMMGRVHDMDFIIMENEASALVLENNLIKKHRPRYNIDLKDDKSYPYIVISSSEEFPRLEYRRRPVRKKGERIFGPFATGSRLGEVVRILTQSFQLRDCTLRDFLSRKEPCLLYQMNQCSAPCVGKISREEYRKDLNHALNFFKNKASRSLDILAERMNKASKEEAFERAALIRDAIHKLEQFTGFQQKNAEIHKGVRDADYIAYHRGEIEVDVSLYILRHGMIWGHKNFHFPLGDIMDDLERVLASGLLQYYSDSKESLPKRIIVDMEESAVELLAKALPEVLGENIEVSIPMRGDRAMIELAQGHAKESQAVRTLSEKSVYGALDKLAELLELGERPSVLECFDVAVFQGKSPTASQVVFVDGHPDKSKYRHYHLRERPEGNNDTAMMGELFERRMEKSPYPDIFIVDGGLGQVHVAQKVLEERGVDIPVVGVAKAKTLPLRQKLKAKKEALRASKSITKSTTKSEERLVIPGRSRPFVLSKHRALFQLLVQMRNEAHRFSRKLHHKKERKRLIHSWIDAIPGVGKEIKKDILRNLVHTKEQLGEMNLIELSRALGVSVSVSKKVKAFFKGR